jgi:hypothetical protein
MTTNAERRNVDGQSPQLRPPAGSAFMVKMDLPRVRDDRIVFCLHYWLSIF